MKSKTKTPAPAKAKGKTKAKAKTTVQEAIAASNTANAPTPAPAATAEAPKLPAAEARAEHLKQNGDKPLVPLTGNGYPIRQLLWVLGGTYDKATKQNLIPEHNRERAQKAIDDINVKIAARIAKKAAAEKAAKAA